MHAIPLRDLVDTNFPSMAASSRTFPDEPAHHRLLALPFKRSSISSVVRWQSPELSIGRTCTPIAKQKCWEATGPVETLARGIFQAVKELLDGCNEILYDGEPVQSLIMINLFMIGRDESNASPTLLLSCERKRPRQRAMKLIRESGLLRQPENAGFRLAESPRPPVGLGPPVPLGLQDGDGLSSFPLPLLTQSVFWTPKFPPNSAQLYTRSNFTESVYATRATLGGVVSIEDVFYGLTVAHNFIGQGEPPVIADDEDGFELSFDNYIEEEEFSDFSASWGRSAGSITNIDQHNQEIALLTNSDYQGFSKSVVIYTTSSDSGSASAHEVPLGKLKTTSVISGDIGLDWSLIALDWALINTSYGTFAQPYNEIFASRLLQIERIADSGPIEAEVVAITGFSGLLRGFMSKIPAFMMMPHSKYFHEVWTVRLNGSIAHGDCGSWVVDTVTGDLYGQIVAGCPGSGLAYIFPAKHIQRDIWRVSGNYPLLPSKNFQQLRQSNKLTFPSERPDLGHSERSESLEIQVRESSVEKTSPPGVSPEAGLDSLRKPPSHKSLNTAPQVDARGTSTAHPSPPLLGHLVDVFDSPPQINLSPRPTAPPQVNSTILDNQGRAIPLDAKWTKVRHGLISTEVLDQDRRRYEVAPKFIAILGVLTRDEIKEYAWRSIVFREARRALTSHLS